MLPNEFPADCHVVTAHGGKVVLRSAEIRPSPHHLLKVGLLLRCQGLAGGLCVLQVAFQVLNAVAIPMGRRAPAPFYWGLPPGIRAPRAVIFPRGSGGEEAQGLSKRQHVGMVGPSTPVDLRHPPFEAAGRRCIPAGPCGRGPSQGVRGTVCRGPQEGSVWCPCGARDNCCPSPNGRGGLRWPPCQPVRLGCQPCRASGGLQAMEHSPARAPRGLGSRPGWESLAEVPQSGCPRRIRRWGWPQIG